MRSFERYVFFDDDLGRLVCDFYAGNAYLHFSVKKWGRDCLREMFARWPSIKKVLRAIGYAKIRAYNFHGDQKWPRFMRLFGFSEIETRNGITMMEANNA